MFYKDFQAKAADLNEVCNDNSNRLLDSWEAKHEVQGWGAVREHLKENAST